MVGNIAIVGGLMGPIGQETTTPGSLLQSLLNNLASYAHDWDADTLAAGVVSSWLDTKGNITLSMTGDNRPTAVAAQVNGHAVVRFVSASSQYMLADTEFLAYTEPYILAVVKVGASGRQAIFHDYGNHTNKSIHLHGNGGAIEGRVRDVDGHAIVTTGDAGTAYCLLEMAVDNTAQTLDIGTDDADATETNASYDPTTWEGVWGSSPIGRFAVGVTTADPIGNFLNGDISRLIIFSSVPTEEQRLALRAAMAAEYGTPFTPAPLRLLSSAVTVGQIPETEFATGIDVDGDGTKDVVAGGTGTVKWFDGSDSWAATTVYDGGSSIECGGAYDLDGDGDIEVFVADQAAGKIQIFKPAVPGTPEGAWDVTDLATSKTECQCLRLWDIDGDGVPEIVFTWQGNGTGTGGVNWLDWDNTNDIMNAANWAEHVMIVHESAWWLAPDRADINGNGNATDILFSARNNTANADPGVYYLTPPATLTDAWTKTAIEERNANWLHCAVGDFFGNGNVDVACHDYDQTYGVTLYDSASAWAPTALGGPVGSTAGWNLYRVGDAYADRDAFLYIATAGGIYLLTYRDSAWSFALIHAIAYAHPMDSTIEFCASLGGYDDALLIADSASSSNGKAALWRVWRYD